jgi:hypothetical protein
MNEILTGLNAWQMRALESLERVYLKTIRSRLVNHAFCNTGVSAAIKSTDFLKH